jgi:small subunit ribosomal protein S3
LKVIRDWNSRWYAERGRYRDLLHEDHLVRNYLMTHKELRNANISRIEIERFPNQIQVLVHSAKPGIVIGRQGKTVKDLRAGLRDVTGGKAVKLDIAEISQPDLDAQLVSENIAGQLERRIAHSRAMKRAIQQAMRLGAQGIRIEVSGRLGGSDMARHEKMSEGQVPRNTLRANIEYGFAEALTTFGQIGVKVWIYKGEILPQRQTMTDVYVSE